MHTKIKEDVYLKDKIAKILFTSKDTREFTESVIASVLNIPKDLVKDNLTLMPSQINKNINTQYSEVDTLYENNISIINIEINYINYKTLNVNNMKYVCHLLLKQMKINEGYKEIKPVYQICINNFDTFKEGKFIYKSALMEEELHKKRSDIINIIDINIDFLKKIDYTEIMEVEEDSLERLLYIFVCNDKEKLNKLYKEDGIMKKVVEKVSALTEDFADELYYDREKIINDYSFDLGKEEGITQGIEQGENNKKMEIAKKLKQKNYDIKEIQDITGLSVEEINNL